MNAARTREVAIEAATRSGALLRDRVDSIREVRQKSGIVDIVTDVDVQSEQQISAIISSALQMVGGFGGMLSFEVTGGVDAAREVARRTRLFTLAESLGGVESLIELPALMTHASLPPERRAEIGIDDGLIRLSVGIEESEDLIADLEQALAS